MVPVKRSELSFSNLLGFQHLRRILHHCRIVKENTFPESDRNVQFISKLLVEENSLEYFSVKGLLGSYSCGQKKLVDTCKNILLVCIVISTYWYYDVCYC